MERLVCLAIGYVFGIFQTAYIYGKMHGIDIRQCGSGNAGATNTLRVLGKKAGLRRDRLMKMERMVCIRIPPVCSITF